MINWLAFPTKLGKAPSRIECVGDFILYDMTYYIFKYKTGIFGQWLVGVSGGFWGDGTKSCGDTFSNFKEYDPATAQSDCIAMLEMIHWIEYSENDMQACEEWITKNVGKVEYVLHDPDPKGIHIDIMVIPPSQERDYLTLVTMGMGAFEMPVPEEMGKKNRAEIAIRLPKDWELDSDDEKWDWPIWMIDGLAKIPYYEYDWLGEYHDVDLDDPSSENPLTGNTGMSAVMLNLFDETIEPLVLENGDQVILYNAVPIYKSEMEFKNAGGGDHTEELIEKMSAEILRGPVNIHREKVV